MNPKMHTDELIIDTTLAHAILTQQFPHFATLPITPINSAGTDTTIFKLGNALCLRFPKQTQTAPQIITEQTWLLKLAPKLPIPIPTPIAQGKPTPDFPYPWSIYTWIDGTTAFETPQLDEIAILHALAPFLQKLQTIDTTQAPHASRGAPLKTREKEFLYYLQKLDQTEFNTQKLHNLWQESILLPQWNKKPVWIHGDLLPTNLIIKDQKLSGIIDFGLMGIGDPACDLIPAWTICSTQTTRALLKSLMTVDDATWLRGRGWALTIAVSIIPYYQSSNPTLVAIAKKILNSFD